MLFNSLHFLFFFPVVTLMYFLTPQSLRWALLLAASCFFYMAFIPYYILILFFTIIIDYFMVILMESAKGKKRKLLLTVSLCSNIGILAVFKYYNFLNANFGAAFHFFHIPYAVPFLKIILPIGLSFHTFQAMSYTIEVYRGRQKAERHFGIYALYVMFYPQLVAGPIERPQNLIHQFYEKHDWDWDRIASGLGRMSWGFFKKIVIADRLAAFVHPAFDTPQFSGLPLWIALNFFAFQIYCDFSGYSDIALGIAQVMGFRLMENFRTPYFSKSISEFWTRWHISLSTWFKDYLYVPLGGNRVSHKRWTFNILLVFFLSGLWHGANWTFLIWGFLNGIYLLIERWAAPKKLFPQGIAGSVASLVVTYHAILLSWVFFRAESLASAWRYLLGLFKFSAHPLQDLMYFITETPGNCTFNFMLCILVLGGLLLCESGLIEKIFRSLKSFETFAIPVGYACLLCLILFMGVFYGTNRFIYFQF